MKIKESGENYLETILELERENGTVRSIDIANRLEYSKPSISRAMTILKKEGYITMDENSLINLTAAGRQLANNVYERHQLLAEFLMALGVEEGIAAQDACRIEHVISQMSFDKIKEYMDSNHSGDV